MTAREVVDWRHDVARLRTGITVTHRIMRHSRFSLCGAVMHEDGLAYVGAWDDGAPSTCVLCNQIWGSMAAAAERNDVGIGS